MPEQTTPRARLAEFLRDLLASTPKRPDRLYAGLNSIALADLEALADPNPCDRVEQARASRPPVVIPDLDLTTEIANAFADWSDGGAAGPIPGTIEAHVARQIAPVIADRIRKANP